MQDQTKQISDDGDRRLERALVSQTLREDRPDGWPRAELTAEFADDADPATIRRALAHLREEGLVEFAGQTVRASRAAVYLNALEMIAI